MISLSIYSNDYYPFGSTPSEVTEDNRYLYNGKEDQSFTGLPYIDYGARMYDPATGRWLSQDPLSEKYYGISPYAYCANDPVNYIDPDGRDPKLYIQKSGLGHVFVTIGEDSNTVVYSYGRYGALDEISGKHSGIMTPVGEGVLLRFSGKDALSYLSTVLDEKNLEIYTITSGDDNIVAQYYNNLFESGHKSKSRYDDPNARVINTYNLFSNNCVTTSIDGVNSGVDYIESGRISPLGLSRQMEKISKSQSDIIKIENPIGYLRNLLKQFYHEQNKDDE